MLRGDRLAEALKTSKRIVVINSLQFATVFQAFNNFPDITIKLKQLRTATRVSNNIEARLNELNGFICLALLNHKGIQC